MDISKKVFSDNYEDEYFKDRNFINSDKLEEERKLWDWIDNTELNLESEIDLEEKKFYLYNNQEEPKLQLTF